MWQIDPGTEYLYSYIYLGYKQFDSGIQFVFLRHTLEAVTKLKTLFD